ncbi:L-rhamnose mutarotase [Actinacidiphila yanglinensis]|uniref:L-rhamnose mutarotase n=1 Tax=Actinacidiphila yanglinensis TaxID=310779 RepID=A0A1H6D8Z8_9ACTN|nr:L-rhamnose mutarotase [Actinacidiphila yanglinensis]SEG81947.1 L-rhamnose mutarotase [Actinacidiphila yanglinensis]
MTHRIVNSLVVPAAHLDEYRRRHDLLWPEIRAGITAQGGRNFSIFAAPELDRVITYVEVEDLGRWHAGAADEATRRWWRHMAEVMPTHPDHSPLAVPLPEVFHQD